MLLLKSNSWHRIRVLRHAVQLAQKAGFALPHPAMEDVSRGTYENVRSQFPGGSLRAWVRYLLLFHLQAQMQWAQATYSIPFHRYIKLLLSFPSPIYSQANLFSLPMKHFDLKKQFVKWLLQTIHFYNVLLNISNKLTDLSLNKP